MRVKIDEKIAEAAVLGGSFFGGGGGGDLRTGLRMAKLAIELGNVYIIDIDSVPNDKYIVTTSIVGAPAAKEKYLLPTHMIRSVELLMNFANISIGGFISSENGGTSTINGWIPSAVLEIPVVDAPANGRAHPTGVMGSMNLHKIKDYISLQSAVGGNKEIGKYVEIVARGTLDKVDKLIREASVQAGGMVAVTRNPLSKEYVAKNAALGALTKAIEVGKIMMKFTGDSEKIAEEIIKYLGGGSVIDRGIVQNVNLETRGGYDIGKVLIKSKDKDKLYEITFWNEYMTLEDIEGQRIATFPDLIVTLNVNTALPLTSAEIKTGDEVLILSIPKDLIPLGTAVKDAELLSQIENVIGKIIR